MTKTINSLASFKRFLALPGATVQLIRHDWADCKIEGNTRAAVFNARPGLFEPRTVKKLQTNAVCFAMADGRPSWLYFQGAKQFRFDDSDVMTVNLGKDGKFTEVMQYRCWIAQAADGRRSA